MKDIMRKSTNPWTLGMLRKMEQFEEEASALGYDITLSPRMDINDEDSYYLDQNTALKWEGFLQGYATRSLEEPGLIRISDIHFCPKCGDSGVVKCYDGCPGCVNWHGLGEGAEGCRTGGKKPCSCLSIPTSVASLKRRQG